MQGNNINMHHLTMSEYLNNQGATLFGQGDAQQALACFKTSLKSLTKIQHNLEETASISRISCESAVRLLSVTYASDPELLAEHQPLPEEQTFVFARALVIVRQENENIVPMDTDSVLEETSDDELVRHWSLSSAMVMFNIALATHILSLLPGSSHRGASQTSTLKMYAKCMRQWKSVTPLLSMSTSEDDATLITLVSMATLNNMAQLWMDKCQFERANQAMGGVQDLANHLSADFSQCLVDTGNLEEVARQWVDEFLVNYMVLRSTPGRAAAAA